MAGIGFELRKIYRKNTLMASVQGAAYSTFVVAGPAVIFTMQLLFFHFLMRVFRVPVIQQTFFIASFTYIFMIAIIIAGMITAVLSRYISDQIFKNDNGAIASSIWGVLTLVTLLAGTVMLILCILMYRKDHISPGFLLIYYYMGVLAAISYCLFPYISALKEYKRISWTFVAGFLVSIGLLLLFFCLGFRNAAMVYVAALAGFLVIDTALILACVHRFGKKDNRTFAFLRYFRRYPGVFLAGTFYGIGFYISNIVYWFFSDMRLRISIFSVAPDFDRVMFLCIFINLPAVIVFSIFAETDFYEKYVGYLSAVNWGKHDTIRKNRRLMIHTMSEKLFFVYEMQLAVTLTIVLLGILLFPFWGINTRTMSQCTVMAFAVYAVFCMYYTTTMLYYFDDGKDAAFSTGVFLLIEVIGLILVVNAEIKLYTFPLLAAGLSSWLFSFCRLRKLMDHVDSYILCKGGK